MKYIILVLAIITSSACAGSPVGGSDKPTVPRGGDARKACPTVQGTVLEVTDVIIDGNVTAAQGVGAGLGGYAGNRAARKESELVQISATVAGAAVGTIAGDAVGKSALNKPGQELVVLVNGNSYSVLQETDGRMG